MARARNGSVEIEYTTEGSPSDPAILLINGFTSQMIWWHQEFVDALVDIGFFVIRYDNRDVGLSTYFDGIRPAVNNIQAALKQGLVPDVPYTLSDMADDGVAVLDALGVGKAHIFGVSMGGMIAQTLAIEHPDRCRTLISVMSRTGEPAYGRATDEANAALMEAPPTEREAYATANVRTSAVYSSRTLYDPALIHRKSLEQFDRAFHPEGAIRQMAAIVASGSRADGLRSLAVPTLVLHGEDDTLITPSGGERTAELVPGAELVIISQMGHDMPLAIIPRIVHEVVAFCSTR
jgi:pimeloyl-ACP methyl ester carboxylesterase